MLEPPTHLIAATYPSHDALIGAIQAHAAAQGYAVVRRRSKPDKTGVTKTIYLQCDKASRHSNPRESNVSAAASDPQTPTESVQPPSSSPATSAPGPVKRRRTRVSRFTGCEFSIVLRRDADQWRMRLREGQHNHPPSADMKAHPVLRRQAMTKEIREMFRACAVVGIPIAKMMELLRETREGEGDGELTFARRDVYNFLKLEGVNPPRTTGKVKVEKRAEVVEAKAAVPVLD